MISKNLSLIFQLIASLSWVASVFIYNSFEFGDILQLTAALAWTISNIVSLMGTMKDQKQLSQASASAA